ncbi:MULTISPECIES: cytochrome b6-f complex subunit PetL [Planktothrix]|uniref:Cytochrome b6-f complex subunit 6 n=1 Tax=Planktothrix mougeotii LEGE 06226 TaxID=1828728 RepID=A0ABR9UFS6_9CYAN|nr:MULTISPECIES: cytochrome b6-f complex subunit 6 [Planktothrix]MBD2484048.1 cytochrome b6-f complex subunit 6 [Planktothrix sp. FACHB-1365]MBE9145327.1 cytochrome b6-f complex subunit 6 [Planktothrix mougeotii LEGE 06226]
MLTVDGAIAYVIIYAGSLVAAAGIMFTLRAVKLI